ncbi:hypothetical protein [uncultured Brevundimonas sp.]|uniref:hypothetical protein n=1 Tax=uncultured Brevundimonas sp. TaxID=213418 RepID=UPI0025FB35F5|nr:hypothetical protein [uncultured Brevundimonas sp.]
MKTLIPSCRRPMTGPAVVITRFGAVAARTPEGAESRPAIAMLLSSALRRVIIDRRPSDIQRE